MAKFMDMDPDQEYPENSSLLTFLITDVRGYTHFTVEQGDEAAARLADRFAALCDEVVAQHNGLVLELRGDEALARFSSARNALRAAVALQHAFEQATRADPSLPMTVGMGLDAGEPVPVRGGYRGGALNLAARLCSIAAAGEILASEGVMHLAGKTEGIDSVNRGEVRLKGFPSSVRVIQIAADGELSKGLPPLRSALASFPTNLPDDPTPFIGREGEIAAIAARLRDPHIRLVTLTGPAGTGKTRLALQVGNTLLYDSRDGAFVCDLSSLADPALVPSSLAQVLSVSEGGGGDLMERLVDRVRDRHILLILDNFEHLLDARHVVATLLDRCRYLRMLVTSRTPLHLTREHEYDVPPLSIPGPHTDRTAESVSRFESVVLFVQRAQATNDGFALGDENAAAVAELCSRLDGLPLAIELAAARIKLFPPHALLQRLDNRLKLLTGGAKDRPGRHQTLRGAIDWSYSLLTEEEQTVFSRLSVFAGGWSFDTAEAVCNPHGHLDLLEGMSSLLDKSLIKQEGHDEPRFSMLETLREYAAEKLEERGEGVQIRTAHARHFLDLAVEASAHLQGPEQTRWLDRLDRDHDNLRAALRWAINRGDTEFAMKLAVSLSRFWYWRGHLSESRAICDELLALPTQAELGALRAALLNGTAMVPLRQGDYSVARRYADESVNLARQVGDPRILVPALGSLSFAARMQEDYPTARAAAEEGLTLARRLGDENLVARSLHLVGLVALEASPDLDAAWTLNEESLALYRQIRNRRMTGIVLWTMGRVARARGDLGESRALLAESVIAFRDVGDLGSLPHTLYTLAAVDADAGSLDRAVGLQAAATRLEETIGTQVWPALWRERDSWLEPAHAALGEEAYARAWAAGHEMTVERVVAYALAPVQAPAS